MFSFIWHTFFFDPIYNLLVFFIDVVRGGDVGVAIIATLVVVKMLLLPLSIKAAKTQRIMREIEPKLKELKELHKDNREAQAREMMLLYKEAKLNPFASIFLVFLQIPIIIALYLSVSNGGGIALPAINTALLYSFVPEPLLVSTNFLGLIDITGRSVLLALGAGITQYIFTNMTLPKLAIREEGASSSFKEDFTRNMHVQMKYVMPVVIALIAYSISTAIALYFLVSNLVAIAQEFYIKKHR
ncbi:MAG: membrane protein insertase YidC [Candidatus Pacebacteria bacterium]|nr:membrane protein insertase YidC [Candidatus Paceibacterota bacterium]MBP9842971.1 membrane protein insertase YidC [Candidatus Paceibacterota bacterium]